MAGTCQQVDVPNYKQTDENRHRGPSSILSSKNGAATPCPNTKVNNFSVGSFFQRLTQLPTSQDDDAATQHMYTVRANVHVRGSPYAYLYRNVDPVSSFCLELLA